MTAAASDEPADAAPEAARPDDARASGPAVDDAVDAALTALAQARHSLARGEERPPQQAMAAAVARAIETGEHLVVQAGTGTGKSLAYLVPLARSGRRAVVATATLGLQDQLVRHDLPLVAAQAAEGLSFALLKGRSNYLCRQRLVELSAPAEGGLPLEGLDGPNVSARELQPIAGWAEVTSTGDRADLPIEPADRVWAAVSVSARDCPGAARCPSGGSCFAELARQRAAAADVVVVNTHLYGTHLATGGALLGPHDIVVVDEAHTLEEIITSTASVELWAGRFTALRRTVAGIVADDELATSLDGAADLIGAALQRLTGRRLRPPLPADLLQAVAVARSRVEGAARTVRGLPDGRGPELDGRRQRALASATAVLDDLAAVVGARAEDQVLWVDGPDERPLLHVAPLDVSGYLQQGLFADHTVILTSATLDAGLGERLGVEARRLDVDSTFDHEAQALLYCAAHLPDPRSATFEAAARAELAELIHAAGGRTLALFTSWRAMRAAVEELRPALPWTVLAQGDLPKPALLARFAAEVESCLFATASFWQGVDVPGAALSLVTIDKLPFPRPDEPLAAARRERHGAAGFRMVDLPRAATLLAQAAGRLIRTSTDRGVVAVLDRRLATSRSYRWDLVRALPPMRRTREPEEVRRFLRELAAPAA